MLNKNDPGMHNQALMELGAIICLPNPLCLQCPISGSCLAFKNKTYLNLPVKKNSIQQKNRFFYYFLIEENNSIYFQKRDKKDIWENLFELPLIETFVDESLDEVIRIAETNFLTGDPQIQILGIGEPIIHILSHQRINAKFIHILKKSKKNYLYH